MMTPESDYDTPSNLWRYRVTACMLELIIEKATAVLVDTFRLLSSPYYLSLPFGPSHLALRFR